MVCWTALTCQSGPAFAASNHDDRVSALEAKLDQSLKLIEQLNARVRELEQQRPAAGSAVAPDLVVASAESAIQAQERLQGVEQQLAQMAAVNAARRGDDTGSPVHGFADVDVGNHSAVDHALQGFDIGGIDLFLNPKLGERTRALFEITFEVGADGGIEADVERAQIGYQFSDAASVWVGRFHTPFGYYNTAFHHGQQIATSLRRPRFLLFEDQGGMMPNHSVGAWLTGVRRLSASKLTYDLFVGNGQSPSSAAPSTAAVAALIVVALSLARTLAIYLASHWTD
jgi:hypothetical protein